MDDWTIGPAPCFVVVVAVVDLNWPNYHPSFKLFNFPPTFYHFKYHSYHSYTPSYSYNHAINPSTSFLTVFHSLPTQLAPFTTPSPAFFYTIFVLVQTILIFDINPKLNYNSLDLHVNKTSTLGLSWPIFVEKRRKCASLRCALHFPQQLHAPNNLYSFQVPFEGYSTAYCKT